METNYNMKSLNKAQHVALSVNDSGLREGTSDGQVAGVTDYLVNTDHGWG